MEIEILTIQDYKVVLEAAYRVKETLETVAGRRGVDLLHRDEVMLITHSTLCRACGILKNHIKSLEKKEESV